MDDVHPLVATAFEALARDRVVWCLLRGRDRLADPSGDVDLLVHPEHTERSILALSKAGFVVRRRWGGQVFLVAWHPDSEQWVNLHVTERVCFGDAYEFDLHLGEEVARRRRAVRGIPVAAHADRFWITLLHALLDKREIRDLYRTRLTDLAELGATGGPIAAFLEGLGEPRLSPSSLVDGCRREEWDRLLALGPVLADAWRRVDAGTVARRWRNRRELFLNKVREGLLSPLPRVALLAPDGAGKSSLVEGMERRTPFDVRTFYLGLEGGRFAGRRYPVPGLGTAARLGYLWSVGIRSRYHRFRRRLVIYDRHPAEARLLPAVSVSRATALRRRILGASLPLPDLVVILDAPADVLHGRKQEHTLAQLELQRGRYRQLAGRVPGAIVLDVDRPLDAVRRDLVSAIWASYREARRSGGSRG